MKNCRISGDNNTNETRRPRTLNFSRREVFEELESDNFGNLQENIRPGVKGSSKLKLHSNHPREYEDFEEEPKNESFLRAKAPRRPKPSSHLRKSDEDVEIPIEPVAGESNGIKQLWALIDPVWKLSNDELVKMMVNRVVYEDGMF
jgi:hypothetical protein